MAYVYPADFPQASRARVKAVKIEAVRIVNSAKEFYTGPDLEKDIRQQALRVVEVFCQEALKLGRQGVWTVDFIDSEVHEFLRLLVIEWHYDKRGSPIAGLICSRDGSLTPEARHTFETSSVWDIYLAGLLEIAESQAAVSEPSTTTALDTRERTAGAIKPATKRSLRAAFVLPILRDRGMTRSKWATAAGVDPAVVYDYLRGDSSPRPDSRKALAEAIGVKESDLPG